MLIAKYQNVIPKLKKWINQLGERIPLDGVILFGSRARGDNYKYSDIDLLVVTNFTNSDYFERMHIILQQPFDGPSIELFCFTPEELLDNLKKGHVTILDCLEEGVIMYGDTFFNPFQVLFQKMKILGLRKGKVAWYLPPSEINY